MSLEGPLDRQGPLHVLQLMVKENISFTRTLQSSFVLMLTTQYTALHDRVALRVRGYVKNRREKKRHFTSGPARGGTVGRLMREVVHKLWTRRLKEGAG